MTVKPGTRLRSQVCATEVVVVKAPAGDVDLTCGGHPMIEMGSQPQDGLTIKPELASGNALGKRYAPEDGSLEVLVTKPGEGTLAIGTTPIPVKQAKPLPSSD
jgi:hypothetical protein